MKTVLTLLVVICAVLACGCTTAAPSGTASPASGTPAVAGTTATVLPNLIGTWTGPMQGYDEGTGFTDHPNSTIALAITEQQGRLFSGQITYTENGTQSVSGIAGVIGRDNRTFTITEEHGGYCYGEVLGPNEIEVTYLHAGMPYSADIDSFTRV